VNSSEARLLALLGGAKLAIHLAAFRGYGVFRDELYYLACADHLAWGYVDHPPLSIGVLWLVRAILGDSLLVLRLAAGLAGAAAVVVTALLAREMGGGRRAMALAGIASLASPELLGVESFYSMNALDVLLWSVAALLLARLVTRQTPATWLLLGTVLGLGLLNKISVLWLAAGIGVAVLATPLRRSLATPWPYLAGALALVLFAPYVLWEIANGFPTREFIRNASAEKMARTTPIAYLLASARSMGPFSLPLWLAGIADLLAGREGRRFRALGLAWLAVLAILVANGTSRTSYLAASYAIVFAAGGVAVTRLADRLAWKWLTPAYAALLLAGGVITAPFALPLLPVERFLAYQRALAVEPGTEERKRVGPLPQHFADRFGWEELAQMTAGAFRTLSAEERASCVVYAGNYGEAGAIDRFGPALGLPRAISGHNNYWLWGPGAERPRVALVIGGSRVRLLQLFASVEEGARFRHPLVMPYENDQPIHVCRGPKQSLAALWPGVKHFD